MRVLLWEWPIIFAGRTADLQHTLLNTLVVYVQLLNWERISRGSSSEAAAAALLSFSYNRVFNAEACKAAVCYGLSFLGTDGAQLFYNSDTLLLLVLTSGTWNPPGFEFFTVFIFSTKCGGSNSTQN